MQVLLDAAATSMMGIRDPNPPWEDAPAEQMVENVQQFPSSTSLCGIAGCPHHQVEGAGTFGEEHIPAHLPATKERRVEFEQNSQQHHQWRGSWQEDQGRKGSCTFGRTIHRRSTPDRSDDVHTSPQNDDAPRQSDSKMVDLQGVSHSMGEIPCGDSRRPGHQGRRDSPRWLPQGEEVCRSTEGPRLLSMDTEQCGAGPPSSGRGG